MEYTEKELKYIDPVELIPYENNPRINDFAVRKLLPNVERYGVRNPILVDKDLVIIAGHSRREAALLAGLKKVPYIINDDLSPAEVKAYRIADNKLGELAVWDDELLKEELIDIQEADIDLELLGFTDLDLQQVFIEKQGPEEREDRPKEEKTTLPMLRFGSNSLRITEDELIILSNRYNEYVEAGVDEGFVYWLLKRGL